MKTRAAILHAPGEQWSVEEIDIDPPGPGEVLVKTAYAGLCHSDEHLVTGDLVPPPELLELLPGGTIFPLIGGHEGAGVVVEVGENVTKVAPGDHVSCAFVPACGICLPCSQGKQNLCDLGAGTFGGGMITDGTYRTHTSVPAPTSAPWPSSGPSPSTWSWPTASVIKVEPDLPLEAVCLVSLRGGHRLRLSREPGRGPGRRHRGRGRRAAVSGLERRPWERQGGRGGQHHRLSIPVPFKQEKAMEFGATHAFSSMEEAIPAVMEMTWGRMANATILTPGVLYGDMIQEAMNLTGKGGTVVATAVAPMAQQDVKLDLAMLTLNQKELRGTIFGSASPNGAIPELLMMYRQGRLKLDELITRQYSLDEINQGYQDMNDGKNIRGVIAFD